MHLSANYWVDQLENARQVLKSQKDITAFNQSLFATDEHMVDLTLFPAEVSAQQVKDSIQAISKPHKSDLYGTNGKILESEGYAKYTDEGELEKTLSRFDESPEAEQLIPGFLKLVFG